MVRLKQAHQKTDEPFGLIKPMEQRETAKPSGLQSLPPTDEALEINIKRVHYVAIMWKNCITGTPPELNLLEYGWDKDDESLRPIMLPDGTDVAPEKVLQMTRCKCSPY